MATYFDNLFIKNKNYIIDILLTYLFKVSSAFRLVQFSILSLSRLNFLIVGSNVLIQLHDCKNNVLSFEQLSIPLIDTIFPRKILKYSKFMTLCKKYKLHVSTFVKNKNLRLFNSSQPDICLQYVVDNISI